MKKKTVVFDFDGVIHSYTSGWQGAAVIPDPVVPGIKAAIDELSKEYEVVVVSSRCATDEGMNAIADYLEDNDIKVDRIMKEKPPAICYIDDRAICFDGHAETLVDKVKNFKVWNSTKPNLPTREQYIASVAKKKQNINVYSDPLYLCPKCGKGGVRKNLRSGICITTFQPIKQSIYKCDNEDCGFYEYVED